VGDAIFDKATDRSFLSGWVSPGVADTVSAIHADPQPIRRPFLVPRAPGAGESDQGN
jgi:hypothetical protein